MFSHNFRLISQYYFTVLLYHILLKSKDYLSTQLKNPSGNMSIPVV